MTNVEKLQKKIDESGLSLTVIAGALGMSMPTFYSRKSGRSEFTASEITKATAILNLTKEERDAIFLGD